MAAIAEVLFGARSVTVLGAGPAEAASRVGNHGWEGMAQGGDLGFEHLQAPLVVSPLQNPSGDGAPV